jgi:2-methylisocitrate lyase-like PEP mutase family enzyme
VTAAGYRQTWRSLPFTIVPGGSRMPTIDHKQRAQRFRDLNRAGRLLLANAWDAPSARVFEQVGFAAVGTTSGGIANARGFPDGEYIGREAMLREIAAIVDAVDAPVSADIEAGYGDMPGDVAETVAGVLDIGVAGINLEDRVYRDGVPPLFEVEAQVRRIGAARKVADDRDTPLVINARTDTFLAHVGRDLDARIATTIERGRSYLQAGADLVFVPGLIDVENIRRVSDGIAGPISLMAMPGAPPAEALFRAGAHRVSLGNVAMLATLGALRDMATEVLRTGAWAALERTFFGFDEAAALFKADRTASCNVSP